MRAGAHVLLPDEDGDGEESCGLEPLDGVAADVEDAVLAALGHLLHAGDRGPVEVVVVLPGLDELVVLSGQAKGILEAGQIHFYIFH